jgi:hypothetical protein
MRARTVGPSGAGSWRARVPEVDLAELVHERVTEWWPAAREHVRAGGERLVCRGLTRTTRCQVRTVRCQVRTYRGQTRTVRVRPLLRAPVARPCCALAAPGARVTRATSAPAPALRS